MVETVTIVWHLYFDSTSSKGFVYEIGNGYPIPAIGRDLKRELANLLDCVAINVGHEVSLDAESNPRAFSRAPIIPSSHNVEVTS
jgi:hypothetical protein